MVVLEGGSAIHHLAVGARDAAIGGPAGTSNEIRI